VKRVSKLSRALFTVAVGATLVAPIHLSSAEAAIRATAVSSGLSATSGTLGIYGSSAQTFINPSIGNPLSLSLSKNTAKSFYIQNNGSISTPAFKVTITLSAGTITSLKRCDVGVLFSAGVCASGATATTIVITAGTLTTITLLMAPTTFYNLLITAGANATATIDLSVSTSQLGTRTINS
jgi:hypothetical protein